MLTESVRTTGSGNDKPSWNGFAVIGPILLLWAWAIWACAEHWRGNPNYSYGWMVPLLAAAFAVRRLFDFTPPRGQARTDRNVPIAMVSTVAIAAVVCVLEYSREQVLHPQFVIWALCLGVAGATLLALAAGGGLSLARREAFPILFFLTAVPWPPRIEQPITSTLMQWVASATTELLHWAGIQAQASGGAIALHDGIVGVTEACSGIRSLQSGIMFGLAMGEWFLLSKPRRIALLGIAIVLAFATNLARTLLLALQADWHGVASVERVHNTIGNTMITLLIVAIWGAGKLLSRTRPSADVSFHHLRSVARLVSENAGRRAGTIFAGAALAIVAGLFAARAMSAQLESRDHAQLSAFFTVREPADATTKTVPVPREIWNELRPTSGEYIRVERRDLPLGSADSYHFFWKPSPWNRFALVHRPDICMPGIGWKSSGPPEPVQIDFGGRGVRCYAFRFEKGNVHALELWGVWRNGDAVPLEYTTDQAFGAAPAPSGMQLEGKRRSATEIVACSVISENEAPPTNIAVAVMQSVFQYSPQ